MSVVDLGNIKDQIKVLLDERNTTTSNIDLSANMNKRVQKVLTVNPARIPIQASWYPYVTSYVEAKDIVEDQITDNQQTSKRLGTVEVKVVGATWHSIISNIGDDPADDDLELLMANIETILANDYELNSSVTWAIPTGVTFHNLSLDEGVHVRAGILSFNCMVVY